jgi:ubiquitin carboxyl-terminal hydrolase 48
VTLTTKLLLKFFESGRESEKYDFLELAEEEEEEEEPVGLVNLGATCYLNSLLQTLFHCVPFRDAIYRYDRHVTDSAEPNIKRSHSVIRELQNVFIRMEQGVANVTSCDSLVEHLKLDRGSQQDPFDFWKLLSATVDEAFKTSRDPGLATMFDEVLTTNHSVS